MDRKYGAGLDAEQRLARLEQIVLAKPSGAAVGDVLVHNGTDWVLLPASGVPVGSQLTRVGSSPGVEWVPKFHVAQAVSTTGYFATSYANIVSIPAFTAASGKTYLLTFLGTAQDGASGGTRNNDFRFHDGSSPIGNNYGTATVNLGLAAVVGQAIYTAPSSGPKSLFIQAQCASGSPAVRILSGFVTVQAID